MSQIFPFERERSGGESLRGSVMGIGPVGLVGREQLSVPSREFLSRSNGGAIVESQICKYSGVILPLDGRVLGEERPETIMDDDALRAVRAGDTLAYVAVIEPLAASVAGRFPRADGRDWTSDDVEDLVASFYTSLAYPHAVLNAHDDASLRKLVYTGLANLVRAQLRRTERGRLHRRLIDLISSENFIEYPTKFWRRGDDPPEPSTAESAELLNAAWRVEVQVVRWRPDAKRNSPVADKSSLLAVLGAIYDHGGGAVHIDVLVDVVGRRLGVGPVPVTEKLDTADDRYTIEAEPGPAEQLLAHENELEAAIEASDLWGQLSPDEQQLVPHLGASARRAAKSVGGGKSAVNEAMRRLKEKFRLVLRDADDDHRSQVLHELLALSGESPDS